MSTTDTSAATAGRADDTAAGRAAGATPMERQEAEGLEPHAWRLFALFLATIVGIIALSLIHL